MAERGSRRLFVDDPHSVRQDRFVYQSSLLVSQCLHRIDRSRPPCRNETGHGQSIVGLRLAIGAGHPDRPLTTSRVRKWTPVQRRGVASGARLHRGAERLSSVSPARLCGRDPGMPAFGGWNRIAGRPRSIQVPPLDLRPLTRGRKAHLRHGRGRGPGEPAGTG